MKKAAFSSASFLIAAASFILAAGFADGAAHLFRAENPLPFQQPVLITSAGQSADVQLASVLARRAGLTAELVKTAGAGDLEGVRTLTLVLGASLKGLGAAGLDSTQEKARVSALIRAAGERGIPILCLHLGGEARRGDLSDEMIEVYLPHAAAVLVVRAGNGDGLFTRLCGAKSIPLIEVERTADALASLKTLFGIE